MRAVWKVDKTMRWFCLALLTVAAVGCQTVPQKVLRQSQMNARQLYAQNKALMAERDQCQKSLAQALQEKQQLQTRAANLQRELEIANQQVRNLEAERKELHQKFVSMLNRGDIKNPMSPETTSRFQELVKKYPNFEFDPVTGVSKFHSDILFDLGSDRIKPSAIPLLRDFAKILNTADARQFDILVVGHTDDLPIKRASTRAKHPTNLHLSTDRANSVVLQLQKLGIDPKRMGAAGYSMYQPIVPNTSPENRARNRRVEIYVLAPDSPVAAFFAGSGQLR